MNLTEARRVHELLTWLLDPHADEAGDGEAAKAAAVELADRAHRVLGAGWTGDRVRAGWVELLQGCAGCAVCVPELADVEDQGDGELADVEAVPRG